MAGYPEHPSDNKVLSKLSELVTTGRVVALGGGSYRVRPAVRRKWLADATSSEATTAAE